MTQKLQLDAPSASASSRDPMKSDKIPWKLIASDLKRYPHFDSVISSDQAIALATNKARVSSHAFFPFMLYEQKWKKFRNSKTKSQIKIREIRYAARADAYIYSYYRYLLKNLYETKLQEYELENTAIAYRRVIDPVTGLGKSNINFAKEAFDRIRMIGNCCVIALDISAFFESIDHNYLKQVWMQILGVDKMPPDHYKVFKAITKYSVVDKVEAYRRLGHFGAKYRIKKSVIEGYTTHYKKVPKQLCTGYEFRQKIAGGDGSRSLVRKNWKNYGIPQGSPISDLLANMYMINFDYRINRITKNLMGYYTRYSDDILIILPSDASISNTMIGAVRSELRKIGNEVKIKDKKTQIFEYKNNTNFQDYKSVSGPNSAGIEYLGFRYDGKKVYLKNGTISSLNRKIKNTIKARVKKFMQMNPTFDLATAKDKFNTALVKQKFGRVEKWHDKKSKVNNWTFRTYALKADRIFGAIGKPITKQLRRQKWLISYETEKAFKRHFR